jgi:hypothetical protein
MPRVLAAFLIETRASCTSCHTRAARSSILESRSIMRVRCLIILRVNLSGQVICVRQKELEQHSRFAVGPSVCRSNTIGGRLLRCRGNRLNPVNCTPTRLVTKMRPPTVR